MTRAISITLMLLVALSPEPLHAQAVADQIGLTALRNRLGSATPTGAGVPLMLTEGQVAPNAYLPDAASPELAMKIVHDRSGGGLNSVHATSVAIIGFGGFTGIAPGVPQIDAYRISFTFDPGDWISGAYLNFQGGLPVPTSELRVQNHSWVAGPVFSSEAQQVIRRFDFALQRDNVVAAVGAGNQTGQPVPSMLAYSYNAIVVGNSNGASNWGPTGGDLPGRSKPDIVGPYGVTSYSTPVVSACAAILLETADMLGNSHRGRMEVVKASLLSGATKEVFTSQGTPWTRFNNGTFIEPLDRRFGAGHVNINRSHMILSADEKIGTDLFLDGDTGWDFESLTQVGEVRRYFFDLGDVTNVTFSATATWLRHITPTGTGNDLFETSSATVARFELRLFEVNPDLSLTLIDASLSPIDNVQHLYRVDLAGQKRYGLELMLADLPAGRSAEDVAIAWFTSYTPVPEPSSLALLLALSLPVALLRRGNKSAK